jgi:hypothetical protein
MTHMPTLIPASAIVFWSAFYRRCFSAYLALAMIPSLSYKVISRQRVTTLAMRLSRMLCRRRVTTKYILSVGGWLKMLGIYATSVPASVIKGQSFGNRTSEEFISRAVSKVCAVFISVPDAEEPVAFWHSVALPVPATIRLWLDLAHKAGDHLLSLDNIAEVWEHTRGLHA